ncbi:polysaccharide deacetylase family protein [Niastella yeongjuensis]|uniref:polysaccharide deacetylase family protein n=1 Tax=Niastella yeongjuensis TaxID=354355 RepID=UPI0013FD1D13|nr:polysaccharide deacetylase family protein [Niastella yeongjuensis]
MGKIYFTCSFDDGHIADLRLAELLAKFNVKATFYIPRSCECCTASLSESEIRTLSRLIEVGGHTMTHPILTRVSYKQARAEIFDCKQWLEDVTGKAIHSFCPPTGRFSAAHVSLQREAGFTAMRTVEMLTHSMSGVKNVLDFVILPTTCQVYNHSNISYLKNNVKRLKFVSYISAWKLFDSNWEAMSRNFLNYLYDISHTQNEDHYFHLWGHSWELSQFSLWRSLERFLKSLHDIGGFVFLDNSMLADLVRRKKQPVTSVAELI